MKQKLILAVAALALGSCSTPDRQVGAAGGAAATTTPMAAAASVPADRAVIVVDDTGIVRGVVLAPSLSDVTSVAIEDRATDAVKPVVVTLVPTAQGRWDVPSDTRLSPTQMEHYRQGHLDAIVRTQSQPTGAAHARLSSSISSPPGTGAAGNR